MNKFRKPLLLLISGLLFVVWLYFHNRHGDLSHFPEDCESAARVHNWKHLEEVAREWLDASPSDSIATYWLGEALQRQKQYQQAADVLQRVSLKEGRGIDSAIMRMQILFHGLDRPQEALEIADELLERDARLADPRRNRIYFYAMTFQRRELLQDIREAIVHRTDLPDHYIYLMNMEDLSFLDGDAVTQKWLNQAPGDRLLQIANFIHRAKNARAAFLTNPAPDSKAKSQAFAAEFLELLEANPHNLLLLEFAMSSAMDCGDIDRLGELLAAAPDIAAEDPVFWNWRGRYALQASDLTDAEASFSRAIELHPLAWQARNGLAQTYRSTNRLQEAGKLQKLAADGTELVSDIRRLKHVRDASRDLIERIGKFATDCGDWKTADGVFRRYPVVK